jgi:hypothetical protein
MLIAGPETGLYNLYSVMGPGTHRGLGGAPKQCWGPEEPGGLEGPICLEVGEKKGEKSGFKPP